MRRIPEDANFFSCLFSQFSNSRLVLFGKTRARGEEFLFIPRRIPSERTEEGEEEEEIPFPDKDPEFSFHGAAAAPADPE